MRDLISGLQKKAALSDEIIKTIRIYEAHNNKVYKELTHDYNVASITDFVILYAESIPEDEQTATQEDRLISAFHFDKEPNKPHGVPFKFVIKPVRGCFLISREIADTLSRAKPSGILKSGYQNELALKGNSLTRSSLQSFSEPRIRNQFTYRKASLVLWR